MADSGGLTCPLCLQADEPESMVMVEIEHGAVVREQRTAICRQCVEAIFQAVAKLAEPPADTKVGGELPDDGSQPTADTAGISEAD